MNAYDYAEHLPCDIVKQFQCDIVKHDYAEQFPCDIVKRHILKISDPLLDSHVSMLIRLFLLSIQTLRRQKLNHLP